MKLKVHLTIDGVIETQDTEIGDIDKFGKDLKTRRLLKGLTIKQLSQASDVSAGHISRIERGKRSPGGRILIKLEKALKEGGSLDRTI